MCGRIGLHVRCWREALSGLTARPTRTYEIVSMLQCSVESEISTYETVSWLELLQGLNRVVDERKSGSLATTEMGPQAKDVDLLLGSLVQLGEALAEVGLRDAGVARVEDVTGSVC